MNTNNLYIDKCEFLNNKCNIDHCCPFKIKVRNLLFINNSAFVNNSGFYSGGLGIYQVNNLFIINSKFIANHAVYFGGAISVKICDNVSILNTIFTNNSARYYRGGAVKLGSSDIVEIINCTFTNNSTPSKVSGGAIYVVHPMKQMTPILIRNTTFLNNYVGALEVRQRTLSIEDSSFIENFGHNVLLAIQSNLTLRQVTFYQNKGCIRAFSSIVNIAGMVALRDNTGGAICAVRSHIYIDSTE